MFQIFYQKDPDTGKAVKVLNPVSNEAEFRALRNNERNLSVLKEVRAKYANYRRQASQGADEQTLKLLKEEIDRDKSHLVQFVYSCVPSDDMRLKGSVQCSPLVGMDVDFEPTDADFAQKMEQAPERIIGMADRLGLMMLEKSTGKGYHIVFRRQLNLSQEDNLKWAAELIGCKFDANAKDITRVFFSTSASDDDLLYLNPEIFAAEMNQPADVQTSLTSVTAPPVESTQTLEVVPKAIEKTTAAPTPSVLSYNGVSYDVIINKYWELFNGGKTPCEGARNTQTYELAINLRCICNFSTELLTAIIPRYDGFPEEEWRKTIENANKEPRKGMTYRMRKVLEALEKESKTTSLPFGMNMETPPRYEGRYPESLRKITATTPDHLKSTVSEGVFGALGTHLHGVKFHLIEGIDIEPAIMQILIFGQSRGKGSIDTPIECINEDLEAHDRIDRQREQEWKTSNQSESGRKKKKEPKPADLYIQICQSDMTNAAFVQRLIDADRNGQRPIFTQMQELDEIYAIVTNGKQDVSRIIRKAFDRKNYGQERVGADSVTGNAPLRWNFTAATTPIKAQQICSPWVNDGTLSRCNLLTVDEGPRPQYKPVTQRYKDSIVPYIARLNQATGLIRCKKAEQLAERLTAMLDDQYAATDCEALSIFASRAITIAYCKAMILYIMEGKWSKAIEDYVEWSLKRDIWVKLHYFGKKMEDELNKEKQLQTYHPKNILDILPNTFSEQQFIQARQQLGLKGSPKEHLKKLRQRHKIDFDDTIQMYVKVAQES